jgi:hypothetical protein
MSVSAINIFLGNAWCKYLSIWSINSSGIWFSPYGFKLLKSISTSEYSIFESLLAILIDSQIFSTV